MLIDKEEAENITWEEAYYPTAVPYVNLEVFYGYTQKKYIRKKDGQVIDETE